MPPSLRHLRILLAALDTGRVTAAARVCHVSQPAASQALAGLEARAGVALFGKSPDGLTPTDAGAAYGARVRRALARLDAALAAVAPRLVLTASRAQLAALIAVCDRESYTLAAQSLGLAQPSVHRAVAQIEAEAGRPLMTRAGARVQPTPAARALADAARLAMAELDQAEDELAERAGREAGRIVVGAMPLSRSAVLPRALAAFRALRATLPVSIIDGPYDDLLAGLRRGELDLLIGAMREGLAAPDVVQTPLFPDDLILVVRPGHPALAAPPDDPVALARYPWVVPRAGTPAFRQFARFWARLGPNPPPAIECLSVILLRELLARTDHVGCVSRLQAAAEIALGALVPLQVAVPDSGRMIGLTTRADWVPTPAQRQFLDILGEIGAGIAAEVAAVGPGAAQIIEGR